MKTKVLPEPNLFFCKGDKYHDPKIGLLKFGPYGLNQNNGSVVLKVGVIATHKYLNKFKAFIEELKSRIEGELNKETGLKEPDFPGLGVDKPLGFDIEINPDWVELIDEKDIADLEKYERKERVVRALKIYETKLRDLATADPKPPLVFMPLSNTLMELCKEKDLKIDKIKYTRRNVKCKSSEEIPLFDFHNALKIVAYREGGFASQLVRPSTLKFQGGQDAATTAWNFSVSTYYKATNLPWKLADIDDETCYAGISFFKDFSCGESMMCASMAQVYLRTGESQVIRGKPFKWEGKGRSPELKKEQAIDLIKDVVELYKRQKGGKSPRRVVIHKSSPFSDEEKEGFDEYLKDIETVDYVHIMERSGILAMPKGESYPVMRRTLIYEEEQKGNRDLILFTTGFVPALNTYKGTGVPVPLLLRTYRLDSSPELIAGDILALTKLDWNSCDYNKQLPVTLSVSKKVGEILAESSAEGVKLGTNYRYYM